MKKKVSLEDLRHIPQEALNAVVLKKLFDIEKQLQEQKAFLLVEDVIKSFRAYLQTKKKPRGYNAVIDWFLEYFKGRNIAEINGEEMEDFIRLHWTGATNNTLRTRHAQLNGIFNHAISMLKKKGSNIFNNPMSFLDLPKSIQKENVFMDPCAIKKVIYSAKKEMHWLAMAMLASTGMRCDDMLKLTVANKEGQKLILLNPKSGNIQEWTVLPDTVHKRLDKYIKSKRFRKHDHIIQMSYNTLYEDVVVKYAKQCGTPFTPHYFRKWIATFWHRQGEPDMVATVLRHKSASHINTGYNKLHNTYIAPLSFKEVLKKQKIIDKLLFS